MLVKATKSGFYDSVWREAGVKFVINDAKAFSKKWMEKVKGSGAPKEESQKDESPSS